MISSKGFGRGRILRSSQYLPGGNEKPRNVSQDRRSSGGDLNPGFPEYEAGVLTARPRRTVYKGISSREEMSGFILFRKQASAVK
jgi:hypothetical protein